MRSFSDTTDQQSASKMNTAMANLQRCRRYMSFPHITTLLSLPLENDEYFRTPERFTSPNDEYRALKDSITVSVLKISVSKNSLRVAVIRLRALRALKSLPHVVREKHSPGGGGGGYSHI